MLICRNPDTTAPGVSISVPSGTQNGAFSVTITFTEAVSDFVQADVSLTGSAASITSWSANSDDTVYTATITPTASGTVTIGVAANVATDAANNQNTAATSKNVTVSLDTTAPGDQHFRALGETKRRIRCDHHVYGDGIGLRAGRCISEW